MSSKARPGVIAGISAKEFGEDHRALAQAMRDYRSTPELAQAYIGRVAAELDRAINRPR